MEARFGSLTANMDRFRLFGPDENAADLDPQVLGEWLRAHPFTHRLLHLAKRTRERRSGGGGR